ncbi:DUF2267 domain-containing protein [Streptomyces coeruleoprunus]|uniref:Putative pterin-4-alpha-carbinolamine dehydratase n=1 Tax=Streptomyces coeruleoprunus TaxID=285563 RepID=A0ABV9X8G2_9ACTN
MITHERLTEDVARRGHLSGSDETVRVIRVVLGALAHRLDMPQRRRLREAMPGPERDAAQATVPASSSGVTDLLAEVGRHLDAPPERALFLAQAVVSRIAEEDPDLGRELGEHLPDDFAPLFAPPEPHPERAHSAADAPAPLTEEELAAELGRRPQWSSDGRRLTRAVALPEDRFPPLLNAVERAARDVNHRADWKRTDDGMAFTLYTRSVDAVTRLDLELADRIDAAVAAVGSGGHPG